MFRCRTGMAHRKGIWRSMKDKPLARKKANRKLKGLKFWRRKKRTTRNDLNPRPRPRRAGLMEEGKNFLNHIIIESVVSLTMHPSPVIVVMHIWDFGSKTAINCALPRSRRWRPALGGSDEKLPPSERGDSFREIWHGTDEIEPRRWATIWWNLWHALECMSEHATTSYPTRNPPRRS